MIDTIVFKVDKSKFDLSSFYIVSEKHTKYYKTDVSGYFSEIEKKTTLLQNECITVIYNSLLSDLVVQYSPATLNNKNNLFSYYKNVNLIENSISELISNDLKKHFNLKLSDIELIRIDLCFNFVFKYSQLIELTKKDILYRTYRTLKKFESKTYESGNFYNHSKFYTTKLYDKGLEMEKKGLTAPDDLVIRYELEVYSKTLTHILKHNYARLFKGQYEERYKSCKIHKIANMLNFENEIKIFFIELLTKLTDSIKTPLIQGCSTVEVERAYEMYTNKIDPFLLYRRSAAFKYKKMIQAFENQAFNTSYVLPINVREGTLQKYQFIIYY